MIFSKKLLFLNLLLITAVSSACFKATTKQQDDNSASFYVEKSVEGKAVPNNSTTDWELTDSQIYNFTVCTKNIHTQETLKGQKFIILDAKQNVLVSDARSRNDGCVTWSETIRYNPLADPKYIPLTRYLRADGLNTGQRKLNIAINPWVINLADKTTYPNVVDLANYKVDSNQIVSESEAQAYLLGQKKKGSKSRNLWIDGMIVNISSKGATDVRNNATLRLDITAKILLANMLGNTELYPIKKGLFTAKAYVVSLLKDGDKTYKTLLGTAVQMQPQAMEGEHLRFNIPLSMSYRSAMGELEVVIILSPVNGPADLGAYEGNFLMGPYKFQQGWVGNPVDIKNELNKFDRTFSVENYMKTVATPDPTNLPSGIFAIQPFEFDYIEIPIAQVKIERETPTSRTVAILMQTVVRNPMENNDPVRSTDFWITLENGTKIKRRTNQTGILAWRDTLTYKVYGPPHYILRNIKFEHDSGFSQTIPVKLHPWSFVGYALGYDVRRPDAESEEELFLQSTNLIPSQMYMGKYVLAINENIKYKFRQDLTTTPYKSLIVNLAPKILNYSHPINGIESSGSFRDGNYLLKIAVETDLKEKRLVSTAKKIVKVREGQINEDIRIKFEDLRQMRVKSNIYFEIIPIDYDKLSAFILATKLRGDMNDPDIMEKVNALYPNLDDLIEQDAGISIRTFVGTNYTPFSNKSEGPLRPTDDLDEKIDADPEILKGLYETGLKLFENPGEVTRFFSRMHLCDKDHVPPACLAKKEKEVADLEAAEKKLDAAYEEERKKLSTLENFVTHANADLVVLDNMGARDQLLKSLNSNNILGGDPDQRKVLADGKFLPSTFQVMPKDLEGLLAEINPRTGKLVTEKSVPSDVATRLCNFWFYQIYGHYVVKPFGDDTAGFYQKCRNDVTSDRSVDEIFVLDQKMRVYDFEEKGNMDNGYYSRINVSSDFRVSFGHSVGQSSSVSFSVSWSNLGAALARGVSHVTSWFGFNMVPDAETINYDTNDNKSSGLGASTSISSEQGTFHLLLKSYERCSVIRLNPDYIAELGLVEKFTYPKPLMEKADALNRGLMICKGSLDHTPVVVDESVYYLTPDPFDGSMIEITDNRNYPWVIYFRGQRDFSQLMNILKADGPYNVKNATRYEDLQHGIPRSQKQDANKQPIGYIDNSIKDFNRRNAGGIVTTFPGVYTVP